MHDDHVRALEGLRWGEHPIVTGRLQGYFQCMKTKQKREWTFYDLITPATLVGEAGQAEQVERLSIHGRRAVLREPQRRLISSTKGRSA